MGPKVDLKTKGYCSKPKFTDVTEHLSPRRLRNPAHRAGWAPWWLLAWLRLCTLTVLLQAFANRSNLRKKGLRTPHAPLAAFLVSSAVWMSCREREKSLGRWCRAELQAEQVCGAAPSSLPLSARHWAPGVGGSEHLPCGQRHSKQCSGPSGWNKIC